VANYGNNNSKALISLAP